MSEVPNRYSHDDLDAVAQRKAENAQYAFYKMVGRRKLLTPEEEIELNERMLAGKEAQALIDGGKRRTKKLLTQVALGRAARDHLIEANLRLPCKLAREQYRSEYTMEPTDLASCAIEGLIKAVNRFDYRKAKLSTYATSAIDNLIPRVAAKEGRIICVSEDMGRQMKKYDAVKSELAKKSMDHEPTDEEYAAATEFPIDKIVLFRTIEEQRSISYDQPVGDKGAPLIDILADEYSDAVLVEDQVLAREGKRTLDSVLGVLDKHEEDIIRCYYGVGSNYERMSYPQIGHMLGKSRDRVSEIANKAMEKLRTYMNENPEDAELLRDIAGY